MFASSIIGGSGVAVGGGVVAVWVGSGDGACVRLGGSEVVVGTAPPVTTHAITPRLNMRRTNSERLFREGVIEGSFLELEQAGMASRFI